jgi:hypothetical protein
MYSNIGPFITMGMAVILGDQPKSGARSDTIARVEQVIYRRLEKRYTYIMEGKSSDLLKYILR